MNCPKCNGPMWDNREDKKSPKAPDWKCKNKDCKDDKGFVTGVWEQKKKFDGWGEKENTSKNNEIKDLILDMGTDIIKLREEITQLKGRVNRVLLALNVAPPEEDKPNEPPVSVYEGVPF